MKNEMYFYNIYPRLINVGKETLITIEPLLPSRAEFNSETEYQIEILPMTRYSRVFNQSPDNKIVLKGENNKLQFKYVFDKEEEYLVKILKKEGNALIVQLAVYALEDDLYKRRPLKGDLHIHSIRSDGGEGPAVVAAKYREAGFDFMGLTDHGIYTASVEAIDAYKDVELGMLLFNGEEVHSPENFVHVVNFGGKSSINEIFQKDQNLYYKEVNEIIETEDIPYEEDKFIYAANLWVSRKIREAGGLSIFAHPHWHFPVNNVPDDLSTAFFKNDVFDAFEVIGGYSFTHENNMQTAFYYTALANGLKIPIVGSSDSHGTINGSYFPRQYTIVFADEYNQDSVLQSIKDYYSVAVENYHDSAEYTVHGNYRFVAYASFLIENYFVFTAQFCAEDGLLMQQYILGVPGAKERLNEIKTRSADYYKLCSGR
ncbi:MAG: hypothetical protein FWF15_07860 [Oscillospiraceae bacterium]|nr:hypothetical protein [Oscillospiraceae bacterium]